jgi:hypothetical protein
MKNTHSYLLVFVSIILTFNTSCKKQDASVNPTITVTTSIIDSTTSPIIVGGIVVAGIKDTIIEKGILFGNTAYLNLDNCPNANFNYTSPKVLPTNYKAVIDFSTGGWSIPASTNISIKSSAGSGSFNINVIGSKGGSIYYACAYAKTSTSIYYGKTLSVTSANFKRQNAVSLDYANVFWTNSYNLFDMLTDEIITPDANGNYNIWYSSNENINVFSTTKTAAQLPGFLFYKFKTQANCQRWCDLKSGKVIPK